MGFSTRFARPVGFLAVYAILVGIPGASAGTLLNNWSAMGKMFLYTQTGAVGIGSDFNATIIPKSRLDVDGDFNLRGNLVVDNSVQDNVLLLPSDSLNAFSVQDTLGNKYFTMDSDTNRIEIESILYMEKGIIEPSEFYGLSIQTRTSAKEFVKFDTINLWSSFMSPVTFESATALDRSIILQDGHADALFIKGEGDNGKVFVQYDTTIGGERVITQQNLVVLNGISNPEGPITVETAGDIYFKVPLGNKFGVQQNSQDRITVETDGSIIIASKSDKSITLTSGAGSKIEQIVGLGSEWRVQQYYDASNNANRMLITAAGSISLSAKDGETLSLIQGGTEIIKINADDSVTVAAVTTISGNTAVTSTTPASTSAAAALVVSGGVGVAEDVLIAGDLGVAGDAAIGVNLAVTGTTTLTGATRILSTTQSTAKTVGALVVNGGVGIALDVFIGGKVDVAANANVATTLTVGTTADITAATSIGGVLTVTNALNSSTKDNGAIHTDGGLGVTKAANIGTDLGVGGITTITDAATTTSTSVTTGSLINNGGLGSAGTAFIGGVLTVINTLDSFNKDDGAIHTDGGLGVTKAAFIGTTLGVGGITTSTGVTSGSLINNGGLGNAGNAHIGGTGTIGGVLTVTSTAAATVATVGTKVTPDAGSIFTNGGLGVKKNAFIGGAVKVTDTTEATSTSAASLVTSGGLAVLLDARIGGTLHAGGFSTTNIAVGSGVAFTVTQGNVERFGFATTGSINVASASGQDITVTSGGNIDVTTAALMYAKFATPATTITSAPTASAATNSPTAAALAADSTNNYVKVYDGGVEVKTQTNLPLDLSSGGYLTATSAFGTSVSSSASLTLTLGTDTILSTDAGTGALTIASATTSTTAPKTTITGSKASADPTGTSGVRFGAEDRSKLDIDGEGIDIYACDSTGGTATSNCGDATLKGSGVLLQSVSGNGAVKIQAFTATTSGTSSTSTVQIKAISPKSATTDTSLLIQAMGTAVITDARASLLIQSGDTYAGEIRIQQRYVDGGQINADRFFVDVDGAVTITSEDSQPLTFAHDEVNGLVNTGEIRYRAGYDHTLYKQVDFSGGGTITVATVTLQPKQSVIVEIIIEGLWTSGASIHRAEYLIVHNNGNSPEPDGTSPISNNNLIVSTNTWTTGITTTVTTATKPFAITYLASGGTFLVSEPMNVIINVRGRFDSVT